MRISGQSFAAGVGGKAPFACLLLLLFACAPVSAQVTASSSVEGTVKDIKEAVIPGATVTATNSATGQTRTATTNESGAYRIDLLPAGLYEIKANAGGFGELTAQKVELLVGKTTTQDFTLSPGTRAETVTVTSEAPLLDQQKTDVGMNITPRDVEELPLNGRDLGNLAYLAPGAQPVDSYDPTKNRIAIFGINGSSGRNVNVTVNGIDNKDNTVGGPVMQFPLEAVQEFVISTQRFSAANGRSEGAAVNVITKSGGNDFHGSAFFFERDKKLNANDFFSKQGGTEKPPFSRQQFGGSVGGPIAREKTFFFFALERQREETSFPADPDAVAELSLVESLGAEPSPAIPTPYRDTRWNARVDHRFNQNNNAFASVNYQTNRGLNDQTDAVSDLTAGNFTTNKLVLANLTLNSVLSPTVTNAFTSGYQYWNNLIDTEKLSPNFQFPGGINFGTNVNVPQQSYQAKYQFKDDISFIRGNHSLKTGFDYVWEPKLGGFFKFNSTPEIDFFDLPSVILSDKVHYPQGFATPGAVSAMTATSGDPYFNLPGGAKMLGFYMQDDWRATPRLTFNLGLRWDKDFNLAGSSAQAQNRTYLALKKINHPAARALPEDSNRNFSPRVGFAYDVAGNGKHVVRGGYGLYYGQIFLNIPLFMIQQANPTIFTSVFSIRSSGPGDTGADVVPGTGILLSNWRFGVDPLPTIPPPPTQLEAGNTGRIMDPDYENPYTQQFNVGYAYQLTRSSVIEVEYVHTIGLHESKTLNINPRIPPTTTRVLDAAFGAAGLPKLGRIDLEASVGRSRYDAMNVSYRRRMSQHFSLNTSYRLSKAVAYNGASAAFRNRATDPNNIFAEHDFGPTPNDERHRGVLSGVFELPWGFQIAPIMQAATARPYQATQGIADVFGFGSGVGATHVILLKDQPGNLLATKDFTAAQLRTCVAAGNCFQAPFNNVRGQPFFQLDTRISKNFRFGEDKKLSLIFQMFNLTNRANFGNNYVGNIRSTSFGQPNGFITPSGVIVPHSFSGEVGVRFSF